MMMSGIVDRDLLDGFTVGSRNVARMVVSYLLFAFDTLFFYEANGEHLRKVRCLFVCFKVVSGLKINWSKSEDDIERLADIFGCWVVVLPMKYLALPLGVPYKSVTI
jgi:hypothetical protein